MKNILYTIILSLLFSFSVFADSDSYDDCVKKATDNPETASSPIGFTLEAIACDVDEFRYQDDRLNKNYKKLMKVLNKNEQDALRKKQRKWIKERVKEALSTERVDPETRELIEKTYYSSYDEMAKDGLINQLMYYSNMEELTEKRADELEDALKCIKKNYKVCHLLRSLKMSSTLN